MPLNYVICSNRAVFFHLFVIYLYVAVSSNVRPV
jgi:hypothetical protein